MTQQRDLLPWIFGGLVAAAAGLAVIAISANQPAAPTHAQPVSAEPAPARASPPVAASEPAVTTGVSAAMSPLALPAPAAAVSLLTAAVSSPAAAAGIASTATAQPQAQPGQIWTCTTHGVRTFSNNPCGEESSLLEVGPINTMQPTPPARYARVHAQPQYAPSYNDAAQPYAEQEYSESDGYEDGSSSYAIIQGVGYVARRRPGHHPIRPAPSNHHSPAPDHSPAPARRKL